jgi:hypothetical protein
MRCSCSFAGSNVSRLRVSLANLDEVVPELQCRGRICRHNVARSCARTIGFYNGGENLLTSVQVDIVTQVPQKRPTLALPRYHPALAQLGFFVPAARKRRPEDGAYTRASGSSALAPSTRCRRSHPHRHSRRHGRKRRMLRDVVRDQEVPASWTVKRATCAAV